MNEHDTNNLMFLLSLETEQLQEWYVTVTEDDRQYAEELMTQAHLVLNDRQVAQMTQYRDATKVLDKFML